MYLVSFLRSLKDSSKTYIDYTDLKQRLEAHNYGGSIYTRAYKPWKLITFVTFKSENTALKFEKYIKVGSGHAFVKKHLW